ncbi:MAG TPA: glutaredoxin family protein [Propionibacteriaceae bacterium]|nr:glutaredoxin family protein [Propionibacteriaceae bacterium]
MAPVAETTPEVAGTARVVVITRDGCHLCTEALSIVEAVCADADVDWVAVDVDADPELRATYTDHVPVTFVDGREFSVWVLDADRLRSALT